MEGFITFIFFTIVGFYVLGLLGKLFLRYWIKKKQREFQERFGQQGQGGAYGRTYTWGFDGNNRQQQKSSQNEGDVTVENISNNSEKRISKDVGEYVDYEEVKK